MATSKILIKGKNNPANLYLRFTHTRSIDLITPIGISVNPKNWDDKNQKIKNVIEVRNRDEVNSKLARLKIEIIDMFNIDFMNGKIINKQWLEESIAVFFRRPKNEKKLSNLNHQTYLSDFATWWLNNKADKHKVKSNKYMDDKTKAHYERTNELIIEFEKGKKIALRDISSDIMDAFSQFLFDKKYAYATSSRMVARFKFFCARAEEENLEVNKNYLKSVFIEKEAVEYNHPYLNEEEINILFNKDLSYNDCLENVRDNLIIGLWTGLRISDFMTHLNIENIKDGYIEIKTQKTGTWVAIPIHKQVQEILDKRMGFFPRKISDQKFNEYIKQIGQICDFDEKILGAVIYIDPVTKIKRKKVGMYKKYKLMTSHICRRSFATNLFGKISNNDICALGGWKTEDMMLKYIKKTKRDSAIALKNHWENNQ
jgi:integrase